MKKALIVVDVQNDFCEGGSLPVEGGKAVAKKITKHIRSNIDDYEVIVFTRDWHLPWPHTNGGHFSKEPDFKGSWPVHCEANTRGARLHRKALPGLRTAIRKDKTSARSIFSKGTGHPDYSGFQGVNNGGESLHEYLRKHGITAVDVVGIAGDFCVKATALDAVNYGYQTKVLTDLVASVGGISATLKAVFEVIGLQTFRDEVKPRIEGK